MRPGVIAAFCDRRHSHRSIAPCGVGVCTRLRPCGWDRNRAGQVHGSGSEGAVGGEGARPEVRGRHEAPHRQRLHAPHHRGAGPARQDARRRLRRHAPLIIQ